MPKPVCHADLCMVLPSRSDHGMTRGGQHGGPSADETETVAVFIGTGCSVNGTVTSNDKPDVSAAVLGNARQVDVASTLAWLSGVRVPHSSLGAVLSPVLRAAGRTRHQVCEALCVNIGHMLRLLVAGTGRSVADADSIQLLWNASSCELCHNSAHGADSAAAAARTMLQQQLQHKLLEAARAQPNGDHQHDWVVALVVLAVSFGASLKLAATDLLGGRADAAEPAHHASALKLHRLCESEGGRSADGAVERPCVARCTWDLPSKFAATGLLLHPVFLSSSSFVENEHCVWFTLLTTQLVLHLWQLVGLRLDRRASTRDVMKAVAWTGCVLVSVRLMRTGNAVVNFARMNGLGGEDWGATVADTSGLMWTCAWESRGASDAPANCTWPSYASPVSCMLKLWPHVASVVAPLALLWHPLRLHLRPALVRAAVRRTLSSLLPVLAATLAVAAGICAAIRHAGAVTAEGSAQNALGSWLRPVTQVGLACGACALLCCAVHAYIAALQPRPCTEGEGRGTRGVPLTAMATIIALLTRPCRSITIGLCVVSCRWVQYRGFALDAADRSG